VEADNRRTVAFVDVVEAQAVHVGVVWSELVARESVEPLVGCAKDVHRGRKTIRAILPSGGLVRQSASMGTS
jgi:hypothetical protein